MDDEFVTLIEENQDLEELVVKYQTAQGLSPFMKAELKLVQAIVDHGFTLKHLRISKV